MIIMGCTILYVPQKSFLRRYTGEAIDKDIAH